MLRFSAHLGYLFTERSLAERVAAARRAGFTAVEHPGPYELSPALLRRLLEENGLDFVQLALPVGEISRGEKGLAALPGREAEFLSSLRIGLDYASEIGARFIQVQSGLTPPDADPEDLWRTYIANLRAAAAAATACGVGVLIEAIGAATIAGYFMDRSDLALRALDDVGRPNVELLFDVFHSANAGIEPGEFIRRHCGRIGHLHIADHPGRGQPGTGSLDFPSLFRTIEGAGYRGLIGCEYKPTVPTEDSLAWYQPFQPFASERSRSNFE
jgi:hydroxypyruvate isomerase